MSDSEPILLRLGDLIGGALSRLGGVQFENSVPYDLAKEVVNFLINETPYVEESRDFLAQVLFAKHEHDCDEGCQYGRDSSYEEADLMLNNMQRNRFVLVRLPAVVVHG